MKVDWMKIDAILKNKGLNQREFSELLLKERNWYAGQKSQDREYSPAELISLAYHLDCRVEDLERKDAAVVSTRNTNNHEIIINGISDILNDLSALKEEVVGMDSRLYNMNAALGTICDYVEEQDQLNGLAKRVISEALTHNARIHDRDMSTLKNLLSLTEMQFSLIKNELGLVATNVKEGNQNKTEKYWKLETGYRA